jgi:hypothetical protein
MHSSQSAQPVQACVEVMFAVEQHAYLVLPYVLVRKLQIVTTDGQMKLTTQYKVCSTSGLEAWLAYRTTSAMM